MHSVENVSKTHALLEVYINNNDSDFIDIVTRSVEKHNERNLELLIAPFFYICLDIMAN